MSRNVQPMTAEKEYEKNPDITPGDIKKLRDWLKTQPHLPEKYITDEVLILTYFCCDKSSEVSKQLLDLHFTVRTHFKNIFTYREVNKSIISVLNTVLFAPLTIRTLNGDKAYYCRLLDGDVKNFFFTDIVKSLMMMVDLEQYEEGTWPGLVALLDMDLVTLAHLSRLELNTLREGLYYFQECVLVKLKEIHFLNAPSFMDKLLMLIKPFIKKTLLDLFVIHEKGSETIYKYVTKDSLPKEWGGNHKDYETLRDEVINQFESNQEYFKQENLRRVNETLRPKDKKIPEDLLGIQGSFKKLDID